MLLDLLGWRYDTEGDKAGRMSHEISVLVVVDLSHDQSFEGRILVSNTERRKEDLRRLIDAAPTANKLTCVFDRAARFCGRSDLWQGNGEIHTRAGLPGTAAAARLSVLRESTSLALRYVRDRILLCPSSMHS